MSQHRSSIIFVAAVCLALGAVAAAVKVLGLQAEADATIRFFLFRHRNATLGASVALYVGTLVLVSAVEGRWGRAALRAFARRKHLVVA